MHHTLHRIAIAVSTLNILDWLLLPVDVDRDRVFAGSIGASGTSLSAHVTGRRLASGTTILNLLLSLEIVSPLASPSRCGHIVVYGRVWLSERYWVSRGVVGVPVHDVGGAPEGHVGLVDGTTPSKVGHRDPHGLGPGGKLPTTHVQSCSVTRLEICLVLRRWHLGLWRRHAVLG